MDIARIVLDYVKVILSWPVIVGTVAALVIIQFRDSIRQLIETRDIRGAWGSASLELKQQTVEVKKVEGNLPEGTEPKENINVLKVEVLREHYQTVNRERAYWEYKYLNLFLVPLTRQVLRMICRANPNSGIDEDLIRTACESITNKENMNTILTVLQAHLLIDRSGGPHSNLRPTGKGLEYDNWREAIN